MKQYRIKTKYATVYMRAESKEEARRIFEQKLPEMPIISIKRYKKRGIDDMIEDGTLSPYYL